MLEKKRMLKNSPETSPAQRKSDIVERQRSPTMLRRSVRGKSRSPLKVNHNSDKSSAISDAKVRSQSVNAGNSEDVSAKRRRLEVNRFKSLFGSSKQKCDSTEPSGAPKPLETLAQNNCGGTETEAVNKHRGVSNQSENTKRKKSEILHDRITPKIETMKVFNVAKDKPSEHDADHDFPASRCKADPVELDSSTRIESEIQSKRILTVSGKERPMEHKTETHASVQEDSPLSPSCDNRGSTLHGESDKMEVIDGSHAKSINEAATAKENSPCVSVAVEDEETIHTRESEADDVNHISPVNGRDQAVCSDSANDSHCKNESNDLSGRYASSSRSHRFVEYWVPARLSNVQLEQYCAALLANSVALCSSLKRHPVGDFRNLFITLRKICNHPFLVDPDLSISLVRDHKENGYLDVLIKASGKLQLLETMLLELKKQGLRVLILYESSVYAGHTIGDILDDFLLQRYGQETFEHVVGGVSIPSEKQAVLDRFNDKESGRFLFLLENRACDSSIKLSSVDSVIIFNSDWNPNNNIRALQKIVLDSQKDKVNIIRLFLPLTVEENAMLLSKHNVTVDNDMHNISQSHRDKLLTRGVTDLFDELEKFHHIDVADHVSTMISTLESSLQNVVQDLISTLFKKGTQMGDGLSVCLKVRYCGGGLGKFQLEAYELETLLTDERWPHDFWSKLLKTRSPPWKYVSDSNKRKRKTVQYNETEDVKRLSNIVHDSTGVTTVDKYQNTALSVKGPGCAEDLSPVIAKDLFIPSELHNTASESGTMFDESNKSGTKKSLHVLLKPELQKLCELLNLSDDVKETAEWFLEYVVKNHHVTREPVVLLQAFQMSVCWIAASLQKQKINFQESLSLARRYLNFCCSAEDTDYVYLKMQLFKELFIQSTLDDKADGHACSTVFPVRDTSKDFGFSPETSESKSPRVFDEQKVMVKILRRINKKCRERKKILIERQHKEFEELQKSCNEEKAKLERVYKMEVAVVRTIHGHNPLMVSEKLKELEDQHCKKLEEHQNKINTRYKGLKEKHSSEKEKENELTTIWKENIVNEQVDLLHKLTFYTSEDGKLKCDGNKQLCVTDSQKECWALEHQEVLKIRPGALAERVEDSQLATPDKSLDTRLASSEAGNNFIVEDSGISASAKELPGHSACSSSETDQVAHGQVANFVELTSGMEVPEISSVGVLPSNSSTSPLTDRPSPQKTLDCLTTSQQLSPSAVIIPGSGLLNPITLDVPVSFPSDKANSIRMSEIPSGGQIVILPATGLSNVAAGAVVQSLMTVKQPELPSYTTTFGSKQIHSDIQLIHKTNGPSNGNPYAEGTVVHPPAREKQPELPSSSVDTEGQLQFPSSEDTHASDRFDSEPSFAEAAHQLAAKEGQCELPYQITTPRNEQDYSDIQTSPIRAVHQLPVTEGQAELPSSAVITGSERFQSDIDQSLHLTAIGHSGPSTVEAVPLLPTSEGEQPVSQHDSLLSQTASDHSNVEPSDVEAVHQLPHLPLVDSSSSQHHSSLPVLEELPVRGIGTTQTANPSQSPSVASVSRISSTSIAISHSPSILVPRTTNTVPDFPTSLSPAATVASTTSVQMPMFSYLDPLQGELERIQKESDHSVKMYEEMKQLLNYECEKEIEEKLSEIRKKHEMRNVELDAAVKHKKNELDVYSSKVYMNKMLAEIFRNKCMEPKAFVSPGIPTDNLQNQPHRHPPESAPRPPIITNASSAVQSLGNVQGARSSTPQRPAVGTASSAAPTSRNMQGTQNQLRPGGPSAASLLNSVRSGSPSDAPLQNSARPGGHFAALSHNSVRPGDSSAASSSPNSLHPVSPASSPNHLSPTGISPATLLSRSVNPSSSGLPSSRPFHPPVPRPSMSAIANPAVQQTTTRPFQVLNHPAAALLSVNSARPVSTTSTSPPTVNLHSVSGLRAPAPHLRSRLSQPVAPTPNFSTRIPSSTSHPPYSSVSLSGPSATNQHSSYSRAPTSNNTGLLFPGLLPRRPTKPFILPQVRHLGRLFAYPTRTVSSIALMLCYIAVN